ncbi:alpha/beta fold hydrolase [Leifsonia shinshuensis]|uniref:Peptidase S9 prolyl oligopeptidase catalytic domain-containing protein n=1 Tax=Leifsonia shinshuensis TaxID=150026 RepID=A0A853CX05_9MICO|nr:hypothetical protein [Leifsonia shinshuensis]NYJ24789.1 hypothetical protein [Leifsonia shinshuensis]
MPIRSLIEEDSLVPIAFDRSTWFFSRADGNLRYGAPDYRKVSIRHLDRPFVVPGDRCLFDFSVNGRKLVVATYALQNGLLVPEPPSVIPLPIPGSWSVSTVVPGQDGDRHVAITASTGAHLVNLRTGSRRTLEVGRRATVHAVLSTGVLVGDDHSHWISRAEDRRTERHPGRVVGVAGDRYLVAGSGKEVRDFSIIDAAGSHDLRPPGQWSPVQVGLWGRGFLAACVHPRFGYGLWDGHDIERVKGTAAIFPAGASAPPFVRVTSVRGGSHWRSAGGAAPGAAAPSADIETVSSVIDGVPTIHLRSGRTNTRLLVSLHGGPDSHEWDDLRYGGAYRTILASGFDILVVNYPGSRDLGPALQRSGWNAWGASAASIADIASRVTKSRGYQEVRVFGVSFGSWLGVQAAQLLGAARMIAISPIFQLESHLASHAAKGEEFARWAQRRFGDRFEHAAEGDRVLRAATTPVEAVIPRDDEVVSVAETRAVARRMNWREVIVDGAHFPATADHAEQRWRSLVAAVTRD